MSGNRSAWMTPSGRSAGQHRLEMIEFARDEIAQAGCDAVGARRGEIEQRPPALDRQRVLAKHRKVAARQMHLRERLADAGAMRGVRPPRPHAFEEVDDRRGTIGEPAVDLALAIPGGLRATHAALGQMRHQRQEVRQIVHRHALFIEREDVGALAGVQQEVGILDALGDALVGEQLADVVAFEEFREVFGGDVGVNRHGENLRRRRVAASAAAGRTRSLPRPRPSPHAAGNARRRRP